MNEQEILEEYRLRCRKAARLRISAFLLLGIILLLCAASLPPSPGPRSGLPGAALAAAGFLTVSGIALLAFSVTIRRCPACSGVPSRMGPACFCPKCGVRLMPDAHPGADRTPGALIRRRKDYDAVSPARGTPGGFLYRNIGLWAGFCLLTSLAVFGLHLLGILARETALGMVVTLLLYAIGGAILFFLNQSGDWPQF